jgi:hypothetical protein
VTDFLEQKQREITTRLSELRPTVDEYERLQGAAAALDSIPASASRSSARRPAAAHGAGRRRTKPGHAPGLGKRARARTSSSAPGGATGDGATQKPARRKTRGSRPKGGGRRSAEALSLIQGNPGITIPELARTMGIVSNYLYRLLPGLQAESKIRKDGRGWQPSGG